MLEGYRAAQNLADHPAILLMDNAPPSACQRALETFRPHNVRGVILPPHLTHVMQPIDVSWARSFKAFLRDWLSRNNQPDRREDHFRRLGLSLAGAGQGQITQARIVFSLIDAAHLATTMGLAAAAFRLCGLFPPILHLSWQAGTSERARRTRRWRSRWRIRAACTPDHKF
jgi:hypothetical protein